MQMGDDLFRVLNELQIRKKHIAGFGGFTTLFRPCFMINLDGGVALVQLTYEPKVHQIEFNFGVHPSVCIRIVAKAALIGQKPGFNRAGGRKHGFPLVDARGHGYCPLQITRNKGLQPQADILNTARALRMMACHTFLQVLLAWAAHAPFLVY